jgi:hypothetical protein
MGTEVSIRGNLHNFVIRDLFSPSNIIRLTNSRGKGGGWGCGKYIG